MTLALLAAIPWAAFPFYLVWRLRDPRPLPALDASGEGAEASAELPPVTVVVPARDEAHNIRACLESLAAQKYPDFEILVVDDRSGDGTGSVARAVAPGRARRIRVLDGEPLPAGWAGKPWACHQGARAATGRLLLFTDADTRHHPELLSRAVAGLREDDADALSLLGRQLMESFWERVVQPHVFLLIGIRYADLGEPCRPERWRDAIANGQFILIRREPYEALGGHGAVRGEVVEDLRLAQELCRAGRRLVLREAEAVFATRMYRSLRELVEGWSKNLALAARQTLPGPLGWLAPPVMAAALLVHWVLPPLVLAGGVAALAAGAPVPASLLLWSGIATAFALAVWVGACARFGVALRFGPTFPLGGAVLAWIALRSWVRGRRIEWKGRRYGGG